MIHRPIQVDDDVMHKLDQLGFAGPLQGCGNTMPDLSDLVPFYSGQIENFNLLVLGQVQNLL